MYDQDGVYLDLKSATKRPLDDIIRPNDEFILSHWEFDRPHEDKLKNTENFSSGILFALKNILL